MPRKTGTGKGAETDRTGNDYPLLVAEIIQLLKSARQAAAQASRTLMTSTYWQIGRRIVQFEQKQKVKAADSEEFLSRLGADLGKHLGRDFGLTRVADLKQFYLTWTPPETLEHMVEPPSEKAARPTPPPYSRRQGQFLAYIYYYTKMNGRAPAETDMHHYFKVTPPAVHQMMVTLEKKGFIKREPGQARSIRLLLSRKELPDLE